MNVPTVALSLARAKVHCRHLLVSMKSLTVIPLLLKEFFDLLSTVVVFVLVDELLSFMKL